jgi:hypothetical protein
LFAVTAAECITSDALVRVLSFGSTGAGVVRLPLIRSQFIVEPIVIALIPVLVDAIDCELNNDMSIDHNAHLCGIFTGLLWAVGLLQWVTPPAFCWPSRSLHIRTDDAIPTSVPSVRNKPTASARAAIGTGAAVATTECGACGSAAVAAGACTLGERTNSWLAVTVAVIITATLRGTPLVAMELRSTQECSAAVVYPHPTNLERARDLFGRVDSGTFSDGDTVMVGEEGQRAQSEHAFDFAARYSRQCKVFEQSWVGDGDRHALGWWVLVAAGPGQAAVNHCRITPFTQMHPFNWETYETLARESLAKTGEGSHPTPQISAAP